jgi:hypothetical protein
MCTLAYAVTSLGAQRLLYRFSVLGIDEAIDAEISRACISRQLRCLEVNPPLFGQFHEQGPARKFSDNSKNQIYDPKVSRGKVNSMGDKSVKALLENILGIAPRETRSNL